jgi:hypothetical protein
LREDLLKEQDGRIIELLSEAQEVRPGISNLLTPVCRLSAMSRLRRVAFLIPNSNPCSARFCFSRNELVRTA